MNKKNNKNNIANLKVYNKYLWKLEKEEEFSFNFQFKFIAEVKDVLFILFKTHHPSHHNYHTFPSLEWKESSRTGNISDRAHSASTYDAVYQCHTN